LKQIIALAKSSTAKKGQGQEEDERKILNPPASTVFYYTCSLLIQYLGPVLLTMAVTLLWQRATIASRGATLSCSLLSFLVSSLGLSPLPVGVSPEPTKIYTMFLKFATSVFPAYEATSFVPGSLTVAVFSFLTFYLTAFNLLASLLALLYNNSVKTTVMKQK
jgi:hypothetical protein